MDFFDKLSGMIAETGAELSQKAKETSTVVTLKNRIRQEEGKLAEIYATIGKKYFEAHKDDESNELLEDIEAIKAAMAGIETLKQQINEAKGVSVCPTCGAEIKDTDTFCPKCGAKCK